MSEEVSGPPHPARPISISVRRDVLVVRLRGELSSRDPDDVETVALALAAAHRPVVVNVAAVTYIDTAGLRWMMRLTSEARSQGRSLILESPTPCVLAVLTLTGCQTWFTATTRPGADGPVDTDRLLSTLAG